ncbi:hypothetical protein ACVENB_08825 [Staphylococcus aureus]
MERKINGFEEELAVIMSYEPKGSTEGKDTVFESIFGKKENTANNSTEVTETPEA